MKTRPRNWPVLRPAAMRRLSRFPAASSMRRPCGSPASRLTACRQAHRPPSSVTARASSVFSTAPGLRVASTGPAVALAAIAGRVYPEVDGGSSGPARSRVRATPPARTRGVGLHGSSRSRCRRRRQTGGGLVSACRRAMCAPMLGVRLRNRRPNRPHALLRTRTRESPIGGRPAGSRPPGRRTARALRERRQRTGPASDPAGPAR